MANNNSLGFSPEEVALMKAQAGATFIQGAAERGSLVGGYTEDAPEPYTPPRAELSRVAKEQGQTKLTKEEYESWAAAKAATIEANTGSLLGNHQELVTGARFRAPSGEVTFDSNQKVRGPSQDQVKVMAARALAEEEKLEAEKRKEAEAKAALLPENLAARLGHSERELKRVKADLARVLKALEAKVDA